MKLISVRILGNNFRNLTANHIYKFNISNRKKKLSTKCFTGLNGSGKSNMLELLSEIFYFLDQYHLIYKDKNRTDLNGFGFEIEYLLPMTEVDRESLYGEPIRHEEWMHIKIRKPLDAEEFIEFSLKPNLEENSRFRTVNKYTHLLLPTNIIAYTSGQNELISNPFYKLKYQYFREVIKNNDPYKNHDRMIFIDNANNFNVFLANFLVGDNQKLELLKEVYSINGLNSFRITINQQDYNNENIILSSEISSIIKKLKACSTCWDTQDVYGVKNKTQYVFDYLIDDNTINAFKFYFDSSPMKLFKALYKLEMLNLHMHSKNVQDLINDGPTWLNISDEIPEIDPNEQIFRIEKIMIDKIINKKTGAIIPINYKNLSDGEHQFNEVMGSMMLMEQSGCLLLMDEPDTHFNPKWRAKFIELLNQMAAVKYDKKGKILEVRDQEVIITTHSPFSISDSYKEDVYIFEKTKNDITKIRNPEIKTYGASIGMILENIFGRDKSISNLANSDLDILKTKTRNINQIIKAKEELDNFGESIEKFDAISFLFEKEDEIARKEKNK